jgi:hypothetical protein
MMERRGSITAGLRQAGEDSGHGLQRPSSIRCAFPIGRD